MDKLVVANVNANMPIVGGVTGLAGATAAVAKEHIGTDGDGVNIGGLNMGITIIVSAAGGRKRPAQCLKSFADETHTHTVIVCLADTATEIRLDFVSGKYNIGTSGDVRSLSKIISIFTAHNIGFINDIAEIICQRRQRRKYSEQHGER